MVKDMEKELNIILTLLQVLSMIMIILKEKEFQN